LTSSGVSRAPRGLTKSEIGHFLKKGYVILRNCFPKEAAAPWVAAAYQKMGCDPRDPATWKQEKVALPGTDSVIVADLAPRAWKGICSLVGGEDRVLGGVLKQSWSNSFVVKFPCGDPEAANVPMRDRHWHKDGEEFQYLDSPVGLLTYVYWSDVVPGGGGTLIVPDSLGPVARFWAERPEGAAKQKLDVCGIVSNCREFVELTGSAGDVILVHPNMIHSETRNIAGPPRFFTVRIVDLKEPLNFNRKDAADFSPVESVVLKSLGVERLDFKRR
jgi:hypothetical protein